MFVEFLNDYNALIENMDNVSLQDNIESFLKISHNRHERLKDLSVKNEFEAYKCAQQLVKEFLVSDNDSDFFAKIEEIRRKTLAEYSERFENKCKQWDEILNNKEEQFILLLKERMAKKPIGFGSYGGKKLEWFIIDVDPFCSTVKMLLTEPQHQTVFKESGYTNIDDDEMCPELACSWSGSDIRKHLNTQGYNNAFSDAEKQFVIKTRRHINKNDFVIPNDISEDYVFLLDLDEFLMLPAEIQSCETTAEGGFYWLAEQKSRGWDDTGELPQIYVVECDTGKLSNRAGNNSGLVRPGITISLDYFKENI